MVAGQVAVSGVIGWIGLVVPHLARAIVGPDHRNLLPASTLLGGIAMLLVDTLARTISPSEIPLGVITALVGTPFFGFLLYDSKAGGGLVNDRVALAIEDAGHSFDPPRWLFRRSHLQCPAWRNHRASGR